MHEKNSRIRLQKLIADSGVLSRRKAEDAIQAGRVEVNGVVVTELGTKVDPAEDEVRVDGLKITRKSEVLVALFHKPRRVVTTKFDPEGRRTIMDFFPAGLQILKPVGRLDYDSEGLLLLTNDGDLANLIAHPRYGVRKLYWVWVRSPVSDSVSRKLCQMVELDDGPGRFERVKKIRTEAQGDVLEVEVSEGRNRFVRRMFDAVGHPVTRLRRVRIGPLKLERLPPGEFRLMDEREIAALRDWLKLPPFAVDEG